MAQSLNSQFSDFLKVNRGNRDTAFLENRRETGRAVTGDEMTRGRQKALRKLTQQDRVASAGRGRYGR